MLYVCMAATGFRNKVAFAFLQEIKKKFKDKYSNEDIMAAKDYDMNASFSEIYKNQIVTPILSLRTTTTAPKSKITKTF